MRKYISAGMASCACVLLATAQAAAAPPAAPTVKVGGYIRLDAQYEDRDTAAAPYPGLKDTPWKDDANRGHGQFIIDSRVTRFRIDANEDLQDVKLKGRIEADFNTTEGNSLAFNSRRLRLRYAYMEAKHRSGLFLLAGQYDNPLSNTDVGQPALVDFNGPAGQLYTRQPQIRGGFALPVSAGGGELRLQVAMEKNSTDDLGQEDTTKPHIDESQGGAQSFPIYTG
jgi:Gram-negative porin